MMRYSDREKNATTIRIYVRNNTWFPDRTKIRKFPPNQIESNSIRCIKYELFRFKSALR